MRTQPDGSVLKLGDVARVELGARELRASSPATTASRRPASPCRSRPARTRSTPRTALEAMLTQLQPLFPARAGSRSCRSTRRRSCGVSIDEVVKTLLEAIALVFLVMYLFLQNFRATLIPTIAVPVVLLGTFGVLAALGYSINMLTMFAMVLAIGLLVDDAIVVVENVERLMSEEDCRRWKRRASRWTRSPARWSASAWCSRRCSCRWRSSAARPASSTASSRSRSSSAMALSVLVALVLTPALCATMLKPVDKGHHAPTRLLRLVQPRLRPQQRAIPGRPCAASLTRRRRFMLVFAVMAALMVFLFLRLPTAFLPAEDQGMLFAHGAGACRRDAGAHAWR